MNANTTNDLPKHMPVDMALAPEQKPYARTHVVHTGNKPPSTEQNKLAQHILSPEKLGLVGYVKDVAGFVKDVVQERRSSASSVTEQHKTITQDVVPEGEKPRRRSSAEHREAKQQGTPFAEAVTGLFPGVNSIGDANAAGCTHADELRSQMMHVNDNHQHETGRKLL